MPIWLDRAMFYIGEKEVKGLTHNPRIISWWEKIKAPFRDDESSWCAGFCGGVLEECGIKSSRSAAARSYLRWGQEVDALVGSIVVLWRGQKEGWQGHVGFLVGRDPWGNLLILGGNQGDEVSIKPFPVHRVLSYRWPDGYIAPQPQGLARIPILKDYGSISTNEA